jgi:4-amino-4-deoxy-L-arabinose transferase-like glycosyltransferase
MPAPNAPNAPNAQENVSFPLPVGLVILICVAFAIAGITLHDPWKNVDAVNLGIAFGFSGAPSTQMHDWLIPHLAGEPIVSGPPLYHWLAALLGNLGSSLFGPDAWVESARLATTLIFLPGLVACYFAARGFHGSEAGIAAPLLAVGTLGLLVPAHDAQPAIAGFSATALLLAALAWWELRPLRAAVCAASALGLGFLCDGLHAILPALGGLVLALCYVRWRRVSPRAWLLMSLLSLVLVAAWPLALGLMAPEQFMLWITDEWQWLSADLQADSKRIELLAWGGWPVLPLAIWSLWLNRLHLRSGRHVVPLATALIALFCLFKVRDPFEAVPALAASLSVIATSGLPRFRRGLNNAFGWFSALALSFFMILIWIATYAIHTGEPARIAKNFTRPAPGFVAELSPLAFALAALVTLAWITWLLRAKRSPWRASVHWSGGVVTIWLLTALLLMPWIDYGKTYRQPIMALHTAIESAGEVNCIERERLTPAHRASLDLFAGIRTQPIDPARACALRLIAAAPKSRPNMPGWELLADVARPGERNERLRLYRRSA